MSHEGSARYVRAAASTPGLWSAFAIALCLSGCSSSDASRSRAASAGATPPSGAVAGYIWDSRREGLRPLSGGLGAARLESPLPGPALRAASPCPAHSFSLGADSGGNLFVITLPSGLRTNLNGPVASDQQIVLSPNCSNGLVYSPSRGSGVLIGGLPSQAHLQSIGLGSQGSIAAAAVSDSGAILIARPIPGGADGTVSLEFLAAGGAVESLPSPSGQAGGFRIGGMAFLPGADTAVIADATASVVYLARQLGPDPSFTAIATSLQGVSSPRAASVSRDGRFAFIANGAKKTLLRIDLTSTSAPLPIECSCTPTELIPLTGDASFEVTDPAAGVIFALNGDGPAPRTLFIPTDAVPAPAAGGAQ